MFPLHRGAVTWLFILFSIICTIKTSKAEGRVVCYYTNWSVYRPGTAKFNPQNINPYLCTHLIYAFGGFTKDNQLKPFDKYQDIEQGGYAKFTGLKTYNKNLKCMLAIGGWNEGSSRFSALVAKPERRQQFVKNVIKFLRVNHFDGLDLDWEYPAFRDGGKARDRANYAQFVQELREEFNRESSKTGRSRLVLTMAVPAGIEYIEKGYDIPKLNKYLDWFNILSYDYHSAFEPSVNHHAPLYPLEEESEYNYDTELNIDHTIKYYLNAGADKDKLVLGIPTYGRSYTLINSDATEIGAPADGPGEQGDATREKGYLAYYEICQSIKEDEDWTVVQPNARAMGPYAFKEDQWVGYDDEDMARKKGAYVAENGLGGIMFWSIDNDDFRGACTGRPYPIIEAAKEAYLDSLGIGANDVNPPTRQKKPSRSRPTKTTVVETSTKRNNRRRGPTTSTTTEEPTESSLVVHRTTPAPPTTPDPGSDFKCEEEGFYPHPRDCKKYFWCLDSGPSNLGIVAHAFTCPSGLYFNKAADSCDFSRNVLCKANDPTTTSKPAASTTAKPKSVTSRPKVTKTTTTTAAYNEDDYEEYDDEEIADIPPPIKEFDSEEDPRVIKELIDLIKKVGGLDELEKQLRLQEDGGMVLKDSKTQDISTTPASISKSLYEKVLSVSTGGGNAAVRNRFSSFVNKGENKAETTETKKSDNKYSSVIRNSRPSPQNAGLDKLPELESFIKEKPKYVTIQRTHRPTTAALTNRDSEEEVEEEEEEEEEENNATFRYTTSQPQYVNIRRQKPSILEANVETTGYTTPSENTATPQYVNFSRRRPAATVEPVEDKQIEDTTLNAFRYQTIERRTRPTTTTVNEFISGENPGTTEQTILVETTNLSNTENSDTTSRAYVNFARRTTTDIPTQTEKSTESTTTTTTQNQKLEIQKNILEQKNETLTTLNYDLNEVTTHGDDILTEKNNLLTTQLELEVRDELLTTTNPTVTENLIESEITTKIVPRPFGLPRRTRITTEKPTENDLNPKKVSFNRGRNFENSLTQSFGKSNEVSADQTVFNINNLATEDLHVVNSNEDTASTIYSQFRRRTLPSTTPYSLFSNSNDSVNRRQTTTKEIESSASSNRRRFTTTTDSSGSVEESNENSGESEFFPRRRFGTTTGSSLGSKEDSSESSGELLTPNEAISASKTDSPRRRFGTTTESSLSSKEEPSENSGEFNSQTSRSRLSTTLTPNEAANEATSASKSYSQINRRLPSTTPYFSKQNEETASSTISIENSGEIEATSASRTDSPRRRFGTTTTSSLNSKEDSSEVSGESSESSGEFSRRRFTTTVTPNEEISASKTDSPRRRFGTTTTSSVGSKAESNEASGELSDSSGEFSRRRFTTTVTPNEEISASKTDSPRRRFGTTTTSSFASNEDLNENSGEFNSQTSRRRFSTTLTPNEAFNEEISASKSYSKISRRLPSTTPYFSKQNEETASSTSSIENSGEIEATSVSKTDSPRRRFGTTTTSSLVTNEESSKNSGEFNSQSSRRRFTITPTEATSASKTDSSQRGEISGEFFASKPDSPRNELNSQSNTTTTLTPNEAEIASTTEIDKSFIYYSKINDAIPSTTAKSSSLQNEDSTSSPTTISPNEVDSNEVISTTIASSSSEETELVEESIFTTNSPSEEVLTTLTPELEPTSSTTRNIPSRRTRPFFRLPTTTESSFASSSFSSSLIDEAEVSLASSTSKYQFNRNRPASRFSKTTTTASLEPSDSSASIDEELVSSSTSKYQLNRRRPVSRFSTTTTTNNPSSTTSEPELTEISSSTQRTRTRILNRGRTRSQLAENNNNNSEINEPAVVKTSRRIPNRQFRPQVQQEYDDGNYQTINSNVKQIDRPLRPEIESDLSSLISVDFFKGNQNRVSSRRVTRPSILRTRAPRTTTEIPEIPERRPETSTETVKGFTSRNRFSLNSSGERKRVNFGTTETKVEENQSFKDYNFDDIITLDSFTSSPTNIPDENESTEDTIRLTLAKTLGNVQSSLNDQSIEVVREASSVRPGVYNRVTRPIPIRTSTEEISVENDFTEIDLEERDTIREKLNFTKTQILKERTRLPLFRRPSTESIRISTNPTEEPVLELSSQRNRSNRRFNPRSTTESSLDISTAENLIPKNNSTVRRKVVLRGRSRFQGTSTTKEIIPETTTSMDQEITQKEEEAENELTTLEEQLAETTSALPRRRKVIRKLIRTSSTTEKSPEILEENPRRRKVVRRLRPSTESSNTSEEEINTTESFNRKGKSFEESNSLEDEDEIISTTTPQTRPTFARRGSFRTTSTTENISLEPSSSTLRPNTVSQRRPFGRRSTTSKPDTISENEEILSQIKETEVETSSRKTFVPRSRDGFRTSSFKTENEELENSVPIKSFVPRTRPTFGRQFKTSTTTNPEDDLSQEEQNEEIEEIESNSGLRTLESSSGFRQRTRSGFGRQFGSSTSGYDQEDEFDENESEEEEIVTDSRSTLRTRVPFRQFGSSNENSDNFIENSSQRTRVPFRKFGSSTEKSENFEETEDGVIVSVSRPTLRTRVPFGKFGTSTQKSENLEETLEEEAINDEEIVSVSRPTLRTQVPFRKFGTSTEKSEDFEETDDEIISISRPTLKTRVPFRKFGSSTEKSESFEETDEAVDNDKEIVSVSRPTLRTRVPFKKFGSSTEKSENLEETEELAEDNNQEENVASPSPSITLRTRAPFKKFGTSTQNPDNLEETENSKPTQRTRVPFRKFGSSTENSEKLEEAEDVIETSSKSSTLLKPRVPFGKRFGSSTQNPEKLNETEEAAVSFKPKPRIPVTGRFGSTTATPEEEAKPTESSTEFEETATLQNEEIETELSTISDFDENDITTTIPEMEENQTETESTTVKIDEQPTRRRKKITLRRRVTSTTTESSDDLNSRISGSRLLRIEDSEGLDQKLSNDIGNTERPRFSLKKYTSSEISEDNFEARNRVPFNGRRTTTDASIGASASSLDDENVEESASTSSLPRTRVSFNGRRTTTDASIASSSLNEENSELIEEIGNEESASTASLPRTRVPFKVRRTTTTTDASIASSASSSLNEENSEINGNNVEENGNEESSSTASLPRTRVPFNGRRTTTDASIASSSLNEENSEIIEDNVEGNDESASTSSLPRSRLPFNARRTTTTDASSSSLDDENSETIENNVDASPLPRTRVPFKVKRPTAAPENEETSTKSRLSLNRPAFRPRRPSNNDINFSTTEEVIVTPKQFIRKFSNKFSLGNKPEEETGDNAGNLDEIIGFIKPKVRPTTIVQRKPFNSFSGNREEDEEEDEYDEEEVEEEEEIRPAFNRPAYIPNRNVKIEDEEEIIRPAFNRPASNRPGFNRPSSSFNRFTPKEDEEDENEFPLNNRPSYKPQNRFSTSTTVHPASKKFNVPFGVTQRSYERKYSASTTELNSQVNLLEELDVNRINARNKKIFNEHKKQTKLTTSTTTEIPSDTTTDFLTYPTTNDDFINTLITTTMDDDLIDISTQLMDVNLQENQTTTEESKILKITTTTPKPTTLHHIFAIDNDSLESSTQQNDQQLSGEEISKKYQKLVEINRIVEINSRNDSDESSNWILEKIPTVEQLGQISRSILIKLVDHKNQLTKNYSIDGKSSLADYSPTEIPTTTPISPETNLPLIETSKDERTARNLVYPEQIFNVETSTIPLEGLFQREREAKEIEISEKPSDVSIVYATTSEQYRKKESTIGLLDIIKPIKILSTTTEKVTPVYKPVRNIVPLLRPESLESNPLVISIANLDQVILSKITTESPTTTTTTTESTKDIEPIINTEESFSSEERRVLKKRARQHENQFKTSITNSGVPVLDLKILRKEENGKSLRDKVVEIRPQAQFRPNVRQNSRPSFSLNNRTRLNQLSTTTQQTTTSLNESINSIGVFSRRGSRPTFKTTTATPQSSNNKKTVVRRKFGSRPTVGGDRRRSTTTKLPDVDSTTIAPRTVNPLFRRKYQFTTRRPTTTQQTTQLTTLPPIELTNDTDQEAQLSIRTDSKFAKDRFNQIGEQTIDDELVEAINTISKAPLPVHQSGISTTVRYFTQSIATTTKPTTRFYASQQYPNHQPEDFHRFERPTTRRMETRRRQPKTSTTTTTLQPRQQFVVRGKPAAFQKIIPKINPNPKPNTYRPVIDYDYYDDVTDRIVAKSNSQVKVILHGHGIIECLDQGNFPHPLSCRKFISCAKMEIGGVVGWEYTCPKGLSYDPVGGICNWAAGLGCKE